ncbi:hypothetical protein K9M41_01405 [Candidatus Gracilibacteria bacterium]|nr:hypothetical protein [Candidatus Gracilibacteria bacterium]
MIPPKIQKWLQAEVFPQRVLLSGGNNAVGIALEIASSLQQTNREKIERGIHSDTLVFRDIGKSFKIDWSDTAKKDGQGEYENVRGMVRWAYQKPNEGKYRIVILENFERVSNVAPHALLKLIEEPPVNAIFLFTTRNHHQLLDTIISRMTVVRLPHEEEDFVIRDEIQEFLEGKNLIKKFQTIETLNKSSRDNTDKKIDRTVFFDFLEDTICHARFFERHHSHLDLLFETHSAITQNINPRFALERLAVKITPTSP